MLGVGWVIVGLGLCVEADLLFVILCPGRINDRNIVKMVVLVLCAAQRFVLKVQGGQHEGVLEPSLVLLQTLSFADA